MSTETLTRFFCDAPRCRANGIGHDNITPPDGWTKLKSTTHIPVAETSPYPARRRRGELSYSERCYGGFTLHLCPEHPDAFADHQPITNGYGYNASVEVSCSCGALRGRAPAATMVSQYPAHAPESTWFHHLPVELRWYLWRGQRQWGTRKYIHGREHIQQYGTEEQARNAATPTSSLYYTLEVVHRDAEGDLWTVAPEPAAAP